MDFKVHPRGRVSSTQVLAREFLNRGAAMGTVVVAREQDQGRGRRNRAWVSPPGGLYASVLLPAAPLLSPRAGIAVASALRAFGAQARLKWPNDVLIEAKKVGGILIEVVGGAAIVGIGVNLVTSPVAGATCLARVASSSPSPERLLERILEELFWDPPSRLLDRYSELSATIGCMVRVEKGPADRGRSIVGKAQGVDRLGRLLVLDDEGILETVVSGDCTHLRHDESLEAAGGGVRRWTCGTGSGTERRER